jgi:hypothetical protein
VDDLKVVSAAVTASGHCSSQIDNAVAAALASLLSSPETVNFSCLIVWLRKMCKGKICLAAWNSTSAFDRGDTMSFLQLKEEQQRDWDEKAFLSCAA